LNEKVRRAERDENDKIRLERINERKAAKGEKPYESLEDIPKSYEAPDAYLDESVAIMVDMLNS
jgi:carboxyl-terminal processing protease